MAYTIKVQQAGATFSAKADETLLQAARRAGVSLPYECGWGGCGTCKLTLVEGETELLFKDAPAIRPRDARRKRILACQAMARSDLTIKPSMGYSLQRDVVCREQTAELIEVETLAPNIRRFTLVPEKSAQFLPGQYAILHFSASLRRAYSMCNLPDGKTLQMISKHYAGGAGSGAFAAMRPGEKIRIEAPFGACTLSKDQGRKVFIAGGTGISPILSLVRQAAAERIDFGAPTDVVYCARRPEDLAAGEELSEATALLFGARYLPTVEYASKDWKGGVGRATDALSQIAFKPDAVEIYVAGPPVMVNAVKTQVWEAGVPITRVHFDSFG